MDVEHQYCTALHRTRKRTKTFWGEAGGGVSLWLGVFGDARPIAVVMIAIWHELKGS